MEVLIWGTGNMARIHSARLARRTDVTITAVISRRGGGETLPGAAGGRILSGPEELETLPRRPDLAVICLPGDLHRPAAEALMGRVPHILGEKPAALSLEDAAAMADRAEETGTTLSVAQVLRSWDAYEALSHRLTAGRERLHTLSLWRRQPRPDWSEGSWLADPKRSGGVLFDLAIPPSARCSMPPGVFRPDLPLGWRRGWRLLLPMRSSGLTAACLPTAGGGIRPGGWRRSAFPPGTPMDGSSTPCWRSSAGGMGPGGWIFAQFCRRWPSASGRTN